LRLGLAFRLRLNHGHDLDRILVPAMDGDAPVGAAVDVQGLGWRQRDVSRLAEAFVVATIASAVVHELGDAARLGEHGGACEAEQGGSDDVATHAELPLVEPLDDRASGR
jgi:hypothetical protein